MVPDFTQSLGQARKVAAPTIGARLPSDSSSLYQESCTDALSMLRKHWKEKTGLYGKLTVLMIDETEKKCDVETEYFDGDQSCRERLGNAMDSNSKEIQLP